MARATTQSSGGGYAVRAARAIAAQPYEGVERTLERLAERLDRRPPWPYQRTEPCEERVHDLLGALWACDEQEGFERVWDAAMGDLAAAAICISGDRVALIGCLVKPLDPGTTTERDR